MCIRSVLFKIVLAAAICLCGVPSLSAQTPPGNGVPVHTVVTVEPHKGSNPPTISQQDVLITEGKDHDAVSEWIPAQGDHAALQFFILIDDGANMSLGTEIEALRKFILAQPPTTEIGVAYMENGTAQMAQNLTTDHEAAAKALHLPSGIAGINGSPYFSLSDLIKRWPAGAPRREVLMISDGIDRYYGVGDLEDPYLDATIDDALRAGIIVSAIYTPGLGHFGHDFYMSYWGQLYMARLADQTGGEAYYIGMTGAPVSFTPYLDQQSNRLMHQYFLTFLAKPPKKAGLQRVRIATEVPNVDLVAPRRVWVPAP
ncbi:MAG: hypothetical protein WA824_17325 [Candidatus Sulfotelmatobacter sp.]